MFNVKATSGCKGSWEEYSWAQEGLGFSELKGESVMEIHYPKSLKLTQIKPVHPRDEYLDRMMWVPTEKLPYNSKEMCPQTREKHWVSRKVGEGFTPMYARCC